MSRRRLRRFRRSGPWRSVEIRRIEIVLAGNPDQGEQAIAPGIGQRSAHPMWRGGLRDRTDRPVRRQPFAGGMGQGRGQSDQACGLINRGGLDGRDLIPAQALSDQIEPIGERGIAEAAVAFAREWRADGGGQRLLGIGDLELGLGERCGDGADRFTGALHRSPPCPSRGDRN